MENYVPMEKQWESHPVLAFKYHVKVYCDVVMDTHLHLVAHGTPENIARFEAQLKRQVSMYLNQTGRSFLLKEKFEVAHEVILDDVELMRKIIYVFRNSLDAGYPYLPEDYPWGVGRLFFHPLPTDKGRNADAALLYRCRWCPSTLWLPEAVHRFPACQEERPRRSRNEMRTTLFGEAGRFRTSRRGRGRIPLIPSSPFA